MRKKAAKMPAWERKFRKGLKETGWSEAAIEREINLHKRIRKHK